MQLPAVGSVFESRYRLEEVLGEGGFATVFRATEAVVNRGVAVKILKPTNGVYSPTDKERFVREVRSLAKLANPFTVQVFDYGETADGLVFMVSELVGGEDLSAITARGPCAEADVRHIVRQLLQGLHEAHRVGLLHRDIKPANIRIYAHGDDPLRAKLLDFGIAKDLSSDAPSLTATGGLLGTPRYMSPEQLRNAPLSPASDLYSLGLVAYEMLIGRGSMHGGALLDQLERMIEPSFAGLDAVADATLASVVGRLLERDPNRRFGAAAQALKVLDASGATREHVRAELRATQSTHNAWPIPAALALLSVCGIALVAYLTWPDPPPATASLPPELLRTPASPVVNAERTPDLGTAREVDLVPADGCGLTPPMNVRAVAKILDATGREVRYEHPRPYDPQKRYPVVLMFHGREQGGRRVMVESGALAATSQHQFVVIAPRDVAFVHEELWQVDDFLTIARSAIDAVDERLCLDPERIYAIGYDDGGKAVEDLRCSMPELRAIATTGYRSPQTARCDAEPAVPYIHLAGRQDPVVPFEGGEGCRGPVISMSAHEAIWRERNQCAGRRTEHSRSGEEVCWTWKCETAFVSCHLSGGHGWSNPSDHPLDVLGCFGVAPSKFDQIGEIWRFFDTVP